jgi:hypothetical protein
MSHHVLPNPFRDARVVSDKLTGMHRQGFVGVPAGKTPED